MRKNPEFERFDKTMDVLLSRSHADLKAALDAEKTEKTKKKRKPRTPAVGRASRDKD
jgi:hypothetical protein